MKFTHVVMVSYLKILKHIQEQNALIFVRAFYHLGNLYLLIPELAPSINV